MDDLGAACVFALESWRPGLDQLQYLNVGTGVDLSIKELADLVAKTVGYGGDIQWDSSKPDGTPRKQLDVSKLRAIGWHPRILLGDGLQSALADFASRTHELL